MPPPTGALALETFELTKRFGAFTAMDGVTMKVAPGSVHALLGENGAGKSTLVKCVAGSQRPDGGAILDRRPRARHRDAGRRARARHRHGLPALHAGAQHERRREPAARRRPHAGADRLARERARAARIPGRRRRSSSTSTRRRPRLAAGEKQKLELLKQLYLKPRLLILDEPTSVLTPQEADEVLAFVRAVAQRGECTVLMITHKFREVMAYADEVTRAAPRPQGARRGGRDHDAGRARRRR